MSEWILSMLFNGAIASIVEDITVRGVVTRGCPQGRVLSPLLWNKVLDTLFNHLNSIGLYTIAYASDIAILQTGQFENILCDRMQIALKYIETWCKEHSLSVNLKKTDMVLFSRKRKIWGLNHPKIFDCKLNFSEKMKYLGITTTKS